MEGFGSLVSVLWLPWRKIWQLSLKRLMEVGFEGAVGLCGMAQPATASQCFCGRHRIRLGWILLGGVVSGTEEYDTLLTCPFGG